MKKTIAKIVAILLSVSIVVAAFAGCTRQVTIECTCDCCQNAAGGDAANAGGSGLVAKDNFTANGKSGVDCSKMPSSKADILALYNNVANATKHAKNMKYQEVNEGAKIAVETIVFDKNGKELSAPMMSAVQKLIDQFSPKPITKDVTVENSKVTAETCTQEEKEVEAKDVGAALETMLPIKDSADMSTLKEDEVADAKIEEDGNFWKVTITVADSEFEFVDNKTTPDTFAAHGMYTLQAKDLITSFGGSAAINTAKLTYKGATIVALIDPNSGYLAALGTYLDIYGHVTGQVDLLNIGGINGDLAKTTYYSSYYWESIG